MSSWGPPQKPHAAPSSLLLPAASWCLSEPGGPAVCSSPLRAHLRCSVPDRSTEEVAKTLVSQCITATGRRTQNGIASAPDSPDCAHTAAASTWAGGAIYSVPRTLRAAPLPWQPQPQQQAGLTGPQGTRLAGTESRGPGCPSFNSGE